MSLIRFCTRTSFHSAVLVQYTTVTVVRVTFLQNTVFKRTAHLPSFRHSNFLTVQSHSLQFLVNFSLT